MWTRRKRIDTVSQPQQSVAVEDQATISTAPSPDAVGGPTPSLVTDLGESSAEPVPQTSGSEEGVLIPLEEKAQPVADPSIGVRKIILRMGQSKLEVNNISILTMDINGSVMVIDITEAKDE